MNLESLAQAERLPVLDVLRGALPGGAQVIDARDKYLTLNPAEHLEAQGPPPLPMCTPAPFFPAWDPAIPYGAMLMNIYKDLPCDNPIWSPRTDEEVMRETITAMARLGIVGVLSGSPERVAAWREAAPGRFIPALLFNPTAPAALTPDSVRRLVASGAVAVFGEVTTSMHSTATSAASWRRDLATA